MASTAQYTGRHLDYFQKPRLAVPVDRQLWERFQQWCERYKEPPYDHLGHVLEAWLDSHEGVDDGQTPN